jgi:hypothetical protein
LIVTIPYPITSLGLSVVFATAVFGAPPIALHVLMLVVAKRQSSLWLDVVHSLALFLWMASFGVLIIGLIFFQGAAVHRLVFPVFVAVAPTFSITATFLHACALWRMRRCVNSASVAG